MMYLSFTKKSPLHLRFECADMADMKVQKQIWQIWADMTDMGRYGRYGQVQADMADMADMKTHICKVFSQETSKSDMRIELST